MRQCKSCEVVFPASSEFFFFCRRTVNGHSLQIYCKKCTARLSVENKRKRNIEAAGRPPVNCDACGTGLVHSRRGSNSAAWDHNHSTGKFRGWLCTHCNRALGLAGDNPKILDALAAYLRSRGYGQKRPLIR